MSGRPVPLDTFPHRRALDLLRFCRGMLHEADLITDAEYAALAADTGAVSRLESYDAAKAAAHEAGREEMSNALEALLVKYLRLVPQFGWEARIVNLAIRFQDRERKARLRGMQEALAILDTHIDGLGSLGTAELVYVRNLIQVASTKPEEE